MFGLDPLNPVVAVVEILVLMAVSALIGWLLGRLTRGGRVSALQSAIRAKEQELADCRQEKNPGLEGPGLEGGTGDVHAVDAPVIAVSADPLLPAFSQNDRPTLLDASTGNVVPAARMTSPSELPDEPEETGADEAPTRPLPVEIPPLGAPIPEAPVVLPPSPTPTAVGGTTEATVLDRIANRAGEINFDRIGRAAPTNADDLKDIVGIGPFLERKLHSLGIYTFRQVANFTKEDVKKVNEIIEFFPGRIEEDDWVGQAKAFHDRKYGAGTAQ